MKSLIQTHAENSLIWCGQAITLYAGSKTCEGIGSGKIKVIVWFMENIVSLEGYSLRDITRDLGLGKKQKKEGEQSSASPSVTNTVRCLIDLGVLEKKRSNYQARIEEDPSKRKMYSWIAKAFITLVWNSDRGTPYTVGSKKINALVWIYENKKSLPGSIKHANELLGVSGSTTSTIFPLLIEVGLLEKVGKKDGARFKVKE